MKKDTHFIKKLEGITMSTAEHSRLREHLSTYADMHPGIQLLATTPSSFFMFMGSKRLATYAGMLSIVLISSTAVSLAAETTVPGDSLYSIKIHLNESFMSALAPSNEGQARLSARLAIRRADEVVQLETSGKLTEENSTYLSKEFSQEIKNTADRTATLNNKGNTQHADDVNASLAVSLAGEAQALGAVDSVHSKSARAFLTKIVVTSEEISSNVEAQSSLEPEQTIESQGEITLPTDHKALLSKATTSTSTTYSKRNSSHAFIEGKLRNERMKNLYISASTTLPRTLETNQVFHAPKTDSAFQSSAQKEDNQMDENNKNRVFKGLAL